MVHYYKFVVYPGNNSFVIRDALLKRGNWKEVQYDDPDLNLAEIDFIWSPNCLSTKDYEKIVELEKKNPNHKIVINHFENNQSLTTKSDMIKALSNHYKKNYEAQKGGYNVFHSIPASYVLVVGVNTVDLRDFQIKYNEISKSNFKRCTLPEKHCANNVWILKPENLSQGKGIEIFQNLKSILSFLHYKPAFSKWVIQKYIERPLLYNGRKFDLRVWVLFTNKGELFVYKNGYLRTSSSKYSMTSFNDAIHLTNWSLQKGLQTYEKHEQGNRLPMKEGLQYIFDSEYAQYHVDYEKHIYPRMKDLIIDLVRSCEVEMFQSKKLNNCFELYGFDFIIDEDLRVWLIEANRNPGFGLPTEKAKSLIDEMVNEMLKIIVDNSYPPRTAMEPKSNVFDLIYTMKPSPFNRFQPKNDRRPFNLSVYPIPELEPQNATGEKRYQVLNPLPSEQDRNQKTDKQLQKESEQMNQPKQNQRSLTYSSELHNFKTEEDYSQKNQNQMEKQIDTNQINEVQQEILNEDENELLSTNGLKLRSKHNLDKPKSRGDLFRKEFYENIKQTSLDLDGYFPNFNYASQPTSLSQPSISQKISSMVLMSPRVLDPLQKPINQQDQYKDYEASKKSDIFNSQIINNYQSQKVILEPITTPSTIYQQHLAGAANKAYLTSEITSKDGQLTQTQASSFKTQKQNLASTSNNFNSVEKRQFINRSYSRSLFKMKQLNEQAQQLKLKQQNMSIKGGLTKSLSISNGIKLKLDSEQSSLQSPIIQPRLPTVSFSVHTSSNSNNNNDIKKLNLLDKEIPSPNLSLPKENLYFSKSNIPVTRLGQPNKI